MPVGTTIAIGLAIGGSVISAIGRKKAGDAAKRIGDFNASVSEIRAKDAILRGQEDEQRFKMGMRVLMGSQVAGFASQNVDVSTGSAAAVAADTAFLAELDALTIRTNAEQEAWGHRTDAANARLGGNAAQSAGRWGAATSIIGGAGSIMTSRYGFGGSTPAVAT